MADTDTGDMTEYALTGDQIRDFCQDAIDSGRVPEDWEIASAVGRYRIEDDEDEEPCPWCDTRGRSNGLTSLRDLGTATIELLGPIPGKPGWKAELCPEKRGAPKAVSFKVTRCPNCGRKLE